MKFAMESGALARYLDTIARAGEAPRNMPERKPVLYEVRDGAAVLPIRGTLMNNPTWIEELFGLAPSLTYDEIVEAIASAEVDQGVDRIVLDVDSPGGYVDGVDYAATAIAAAAKPVEARVSGMATSAAYWLASQAGRIVATSRLASFGSIGVARTVVKEPGVYEFASSAAPNKRPDPDTKDGQAAIRQELDAIHAIFAGDVARGRGVTVDKVNEEFGRGGTMLSERALAAGMIDLIEVKNAGVADEKPAGAKDTKGVKSMTIEQIKAEAPEVAAALRDEGIQAERKRVAGLSAWKGINADADKAVEEAVASGKAYDDVAAQLAAAVAKGNSKSADGENAGSLQTGTATNGANAIAPDTVAGMTDKDIADLKAAGMTIEQIRANAPRGE